MLDREVKGLGLPLLYLDFDGVLHPEYCYWHPRKGPYQRCQLLVRMYKALENLAGKDLGLCILWMRSQNEIAG